MILENSVSFVNHMIRTNIKQVQFNKNDDQLKIIINLNDEYSIILWKWETEQFFFIVTRGIFILYIFYAVDAAKAEA